MTSQAPSVTTPTSPSTNVVTTPSGDAMNTTTATFRQGDTAYWTAVVSLTDLTYVLQEDVGGAEGPNGERRGPTWQKGFEVQLVPWNSSEYGVEIVTGSIIDEYTVYQMNGVWMGAFPAEPSGGETAPASPG
jgi:hypothetical protein